MKKRVMLVDDDPTMHNVVRIVLSETEYELCIAASGQECLEELRKGFDGLIFMDIMMPDADGWDTITAMVREDLLNGCAICMFTALSDVAPKDPELKQYIVGSLSKPFTYDQLINAVEEYMAKIE